MLITRGGFRVFTEYDLGSILDSRIRDIGKSILSDPAVSSLENTEQYIQGILEKNRVPRIELDVDSVNADLKKAMIPARYFPFNYNVERGQQYEKNVASFKIPFTGDETLFHCKPSTFVMWSEEVAIENNLLIFEVIAFSDDADHLKKERDDMIGHLQQQIGNVNQQVDNFNNILQEKVSQFVQNAKNQNQKDDDLLSKLNS